MSQSRLIPEPDRLLAKLLEGELPEAEREELNRLLRDDASLRRLYREYMILDALLRWEIAPPLMRVGDQRRGARGEGREMAGSPAIDLPAGAAVEHPVGATVELPSGQWSQIPNPEPPIPPIVLDLSSTTHYPLPTSHFSVGSWAFSYTVATVIMGVMLLGFWAIKVTHHQHIAEAPSQSVPSDAMPEMVFVGRITGMVDVKWSDDPRYSPPMGFAHVPLGRKYILDSGLMEITYDTGAKVILQGPCSYEVESTASGYLSLGKLTARVEAVKGKGSRSKVQGSRSKAEPSSFILHPSSLFSVRTPTAVVTDLGTEFGVEVDRSGVTESHVFRRSVRVQVVGNGLPSPSGRGAGGEGSGRELILRENESARVQHGKGGQDRLVIVRGTADMAGFVRVGQLAKLAEQLHPTPLRRWQAWSKELRNRDDLLAYYDFQRDDSDRSVLRNRAATGKQFDGRIESPAWVPGRFPGKHALRFGWPGNGVRVNIPIECKQLTLLAWVNLDSLPSPPECGGLLLSDGWNRVGFSRANFAGRIHWQIRYDGTISFTLDNRSGNMRSRPVFDNAETLGHWCHLAAVYVHGPEASRAALYLDGEHVGDRENITAAAQSTMAAKIGPAMIGAWWDSRDADCTCASYPLGGRIDELMIFRSALGAKEIHDVYESTRPLNPKRHYVWKGGQPMNGP